MILDSCYYYPYKIKLINLKQDDKKEYKCIFFAGFYKTIFQNYFCLRTLII
ncbi:hypothetical protein ANASTE_00139 [Anaerofustis stercorihominis DSM 17244]|uniref:Uncharacterized protein n=1 Tax=Anaerofustis stercorihominis DSM 17244 TaxID=445971 RepID=B1C601_9FIRM|nr:hypothetical protein ANASTE_00139 [Anaerofustis stercorihominis DSM 17244]